MGSRGYLVLRHAIMAQGTLECNIVLLYLMYLLYMIACLDASLSKTHGIALFCASRRIEMWMPVE